MNGHITKHRHGNRNFLPSISRAISMQYTIPRFRNKFVKSENSRTIIREMYKTIGENHPTESYERRS